MGSPWSSISDRVLVPPWQVRLIQKRYIVSRSHYRADIRLNYWKMLWLINLNICSLWRRSWHLCSPAYLVFHPPHHRYSSLLSSLCYQGCSGQFSILSTLFFNRFAGVWANSHIQTWPSAFLVCFSSFLVLTFTRRLIWGSGTSMSLHKRYICVLRTLDLFYLTLNWIY